MGSITTAAVTRYQKGLFAADHCFNPDTAFTADTTDTSQVLTNVSSLEDLAVGMSVSGAGIAANTVITRILGDDSVEISKPATATAAGVSLTATGDQFNFALIKPAPTGDYGEATESYAELVADSDETAGTGYVAGGFALSSTGPVIDDGVALVDFSPDPSWIGASISTEGALIYNTTRRGPLEDPVVSVHAFGGTQTVTDGTMTIVLPVPDKDNAILRIQ